MEHPTFVRLEYWDKGLVDWKVGHGGMNLMNPTTYVQKLAKRGIIARAVDVDTGETVYGGGSDLL